MQHPRIKLATPFVLGHTYREMRVGETEGRQRFQLCGGDVVYTYDRRIYSGDYEISLRDSKDREWVRFSPTMKIIRHGYSWNGNSPKYGFRIFGKDVWLGTPDFEATRAASASHDADFQFSHCEHFPSALTLDVVNHHYFEILRSRRFCLAGVYHEALKDFSRPVWDGKAGTDVYSKII